MDIPRAEYPRPQCVRDDWVCLNGLWQFEIDQGDSGRERGLLMRDLTDRILVPFCPESACSGIGNTDFLNAVWYRRRIVVPESWSGRRVLLHFQAVDYDTTVWVEGVEVARHRGGWTPFTVDITAVAPPGAEATVVVRARDDGREWKPQGKQSTSYANAGCHYTRTTGIWQSVWLEPVHAVHLLRPRITPLFTAGAFEVVVPVSLPRGGYRVHSVLRDDRGAVATAEADFADAPAARLRLEVPADRRRNWSPADPFLYDLELELCDGTGAVVDRVRSYAGLRSVSIDGNRILLNGAPVFQRLVLDQGYYPDGIMTAPSDAALVADIELAMAAGFNGARLHQKVFEERFLYHADRLGYLVWGEFGDWYADHHRGIPSEWAPMTYANQWNEVLERDHSHPAIIGWCPVNESIIKQRDGIDAFDDMTRAVYRSTKLADPQRPVIDASGWTHRVANADVYDIHCYAQDPQALHDYTCRRLAGEPMSYHRSDLQDLAYDPHAGRPFLVSEFGGIWWNAEIAAARGDGDEAQSWGYGERVRDLEQFHQRFAGLCGVLLDQDGICGYCYTQLCDVFQEQNGVLGFDRQPKFDLARLRAVQERPAAIESA
ncbi:MAG: glycoside hydrolase family 2 protein [Planctomycetota bacterium]